MQVLLLFMFYCSGTRSSNLLRHLQKGFLPAVCSLPVPGYMVRVLHNCLVICLSKMFISLVFMFFSSLGRLLSARMQQLRQPGMVSLQLTGQKAS